MSAPRELPEALLPVPERPTTDADAEAWRVPCEVCGARRGAPCYWSVHGAQASWRTHQARRDSTKRG